MNDVPDNSSAEAKEIEELKKQVEDVTNNWKRAVADYQNLEKRVEREREDFSKFSNLIILMKLINLLENLEKAQSHLHDDGLDIMLKELKNTISEQGVDEVSVKVGDEFDPRLAECVEVASGEADDNRIIEVIAKGYIIGDRVIRPAKVKVSAKGGFAPLQGSEDPSGSRTTGGQNYE